VLPPETNGRVHHARLSLLFSMITITSYFPQRSVPKTWTGQNGTRSESFRNGLKNTRPSQHRSKSGKGRSSFSGPRQATEPRVKLRNGCMAAAIVSARGQRVAILASLLQPLSLSPDWHTG
jgi:hypothetical protein